MQDTVLPAAKEAAISPEEQMVKNKAAIQLLQSWFEEDEAEQRDTLAKLRIALDEDRLSDRRLFP
jgi:hypothetical protein